MMNQALLQTSGPVPRPSPAAPPAFDPSYEATLLRIARRADELVRASEPRAVHLSDRWFWMKAEREVLGSPSAYAAHALLRLCARWTRRSDSRPRQTCGA